MATPTTLLAGIVTRFTSTVLVTYPKMSVWYGQAPEGTATPLTVLKYRADFEWNFEPTEMYYTKGELTFHVFAAGLATVEGMASSITTVFNQNETSISIVNAADFSMQQKTYMVDVEPDRTVDQEQIYRAELMFEVFVSWFLPVSSP